MMALLLWGVTGGAGLTDAGAYRSQVHDGSYYSPDMTKIAYLAGDRLKRNLLHALDKTSPILATSFVNIDNPRASSTFGRLLGTLIASRFSQHGYKVVESTLLRGKAIPHNAQGIIAGTYSFSDDLAFVSTKIISTRDKSILSSHDFVIEVDTTSKQPDSGRLVKRVERAEQEPEGPQKESEQKAPAKSVKTGPYSSGSIVLDPSNRLHAKIIQTRLHQLGFYSSKIDGRWGNESMAALARFKTKRNLKKVYEWDLVAQKALFLGTGQ